MELQISLNSMINGRFLQMEYSVYFCIIIYLILYAFERYDGSYIFQLYENGREILGKTSKQVTNPSPIICLISFDIEYYLLKKMEKKKTYSNGDILNLFIYLWECR